MLRSKRKALRLSQAKAAKILGINRCTLSSIERKYLINLNLFLLLDICKLYNINILEIINWLLSK